MPGVAGITTIRDLEAFGRIGGIGQMENKQVIQYTGSFAYEAQSM